MKKTLSLILALLMSVSCASYIFADDAEVTAISEDAAVEEAVEEVETPAEEATPYDRAIRFLTTYNVMHGYEDGLLHAEKDVERYQMALFIGRITTGWVEDDSWEDFDANDSGFSDLKGTAAENVYGAMSYVSQKGIIEGYPDGTFKPEKVVTYREALTMAVRALGYQGLEYPWGYIEEAVSLGLTDCITGVAYTDVINRGVAAQIIYNAMFADGSKLAAKNFDGALGWANIIITSSVINDTTVDYDKNDERATFTTAEYKTPVDYVSFQVIEKDGTLSKDIYYVKASELALDEGHDDELAIGTPYAALFKIDADDNYVELIDYEAYAPTTVKNEGRTDNEGVAYDVVDNIGAFLKNYTLVDKYSAKILANEGKLANELIVATAVNYDVMDLDYYHAGYAFDWATGNILKATEDAKYDKDTKTYSDYEPVWYYDAAHDYYFEIVTKEVTIDGEKVEEYVGINVMDDADLAKLLEAIDKAAAVKVGEDTKYQFTTSIGSAIYATLNAYNVDADAEADYATYEAYSYGYISQKSDAAKCKKCDANRASLMINGNRVDFLESVDCGANEHFDGIWWQDEYAPVLDEDGKIEGAYVIYGYNPVTKELKVIKTIEEYSDDLVDADTYYATGILRGYSISKGYVVIGDQKIYFNEDFGSFDIDNEKIVLKDGKEVNYKKDNAYKALLTAKFDGLFNQFVKYYVLDGKVVEIETVGATSSNYIVVESYAGISNDGYIVVNGYSTDDLKLDRFKIAVYNSWNNGSYFWYGFENNAAAAFVKGQVYKITSYDAENDLYFVDLMADVKKVEGQFGTETVLEVVTDKPVVTLTFNQGYRIYKEAGKDAASPKKVSSSDKYIIIGEGKKGYMPIAVFEGKVSDPTWTVTGNLLVGAADKTTFIFVNATTKGFNLDAWSNAGLVMALKNIVLDRFFDGAGLDEDEWYLNGATENNNVLVFNFLTGNFEYVASATNVKITKGNVYKTVDGVIVDDFTNVWWSDSYDSIYTEIENVYADKAYTTTADYIFDPYVVVDIDLFGDKAKDELSLNEVSEYFLDKLEVKGLVNSLKIVKLDLDEKTNVVKDILPYGKDDFKKDTKDNGIESFVAAGVYKINENGTVDAVIYVTDTVDAAVVEKDASTTSSNVLPTVVDNAYIGGTVDAEIVTTIENAETRKTLSINGIGFEFVGDLVENNNHADIKAKNLYFDLIDRCVETDNWNTELYITPNGAAVIPSENVWDNQIEYVAYGDDEDGCNIMKAFNLVFDKAVVVEEGSWVTFGVVYNYQGYYQHAYNLTVGLINGKVVCEFSNNAPFDNHFGADLITPVVID